MTTSRIVAIDPGTRCGWAVRDGGVDIAGTWDLSPRRFEGGGMRYLRFRRLLVETLDAAPVSLVVYEEVRRHLGTDAAHVYGGLVAVLQAECETRSLPYLGVPVGTVKRRATGKGNADKGAMVDAAKARWAGLEIPDDNAADALWLLECGAAEMPAERCPATGEDPSR